MERLEVWRRYLGEDDVTMSRLSGGINSAVYKVENTRGVYTLKLYYEHQGDSARDGMRAEIEFLKYANKVCKSGVPEIHEIDRENKAVLMEYISGTEFDPGRFYSYEVIGQFVSFFKEINRDRELALNAISMSAAEGFQRLTDHMNCLRGRLQRMSSEHLPSHLRERGRNVIQALESDFYTTEERVLSMISNGDVEDLIDQELLVISASDYGLHNVIERDGKAVFIDFEYSGWDDPCKAVLDFYLQPSMHMNRSCLYLLDAFDPVQKGYIHKRCKAVQPILELKWRCIIANWLDPAKAKRLAFGLGEGWNAEYVEKKLDVLGA